MKTLKEMTLKEKIGQLVMCGFTSLEYNDHIKLLVDEWACGNVILFSRNFDNANQLKKLDRDIHQNIMAKTGIMPFISIDQEGGQVTRLFKDATFPAGAMSSAASNLEHAPYYNARIIGRDMINLGINMNLAPSLDVNNNLDNPSINVRSFSSDPKTVAVCGREYIKGLREYGVMACIKHFPGAGDSVVDSHLALPTIDHDKERLHKIELYPFKENFDSPCLMTEHALFPTYDTVPATLSYNVLTNLLRKELGYTGIIVTDGIEMKAIADNYGVGLGSLMAINAGCDMVLVCHTLEEQLEVLNTLTEAANDGRLPIEVIDDRVSRILKFKEESKKNLDKFFVEGPFEIVEENNQMTQKIVDESLTHICGTLPKFDSNTLVIAPKAVAKTIVEDEFDNRNLGVNLKKEFPNLKVLEYQQTEEFVNDALNESKNYQNVIIFSYNAVVDSIQVKLINELIEKKNAHIISLKGPLDYHLYPNIKNYMCLYEYTPLSIKTVLKYFKGLLKPNGHSPVDPIK